MRSDVEIVGQRLVEVGEEIGSHMSECPVSGFQDEEGRVALCVPDASAPLGTRLL